MQTSTQSKARRRAAAAAIAVTIAAPAEGLRQWAYYDPPGILTVCRGHTGPDVIKGKKYSMAECDQFMSDDMRAAVAAVDSCAPGLPPNVLAAFGDAAFNIGATVACDRNKSTAARYLYAGKLLEACGQLPRWNKAKVAGFMVPLPGLTKRRDMEYQVCIKDLT